MSRILKFVAGLCAFAAIAAVIGLVVTRQFASDKDATTSSQSAEHEHDHDHEQDSPPAVKLRKQARKNLELVSKPLKATEYWRTINLPGMIEDRPGVSDRGVVAPITGVVIKIDAYPGKAVEPKAPLFSIRLLSDALHASQLELFKATKEIEIARRQHERLEKPAQAGAVPQSRLLEIQNQVDRLNVAVQAYEQDLRSRGLSDEQIANSAKGEFVTEIVVYAPGDEEVEQTEVALASYESGEPKELPFTFEVQSLKVELGQQVEAGEVLCILADHRRLLIAGHGFKDDMPLVQKAAQNRWPIGVDFDDMPAGDWPPPPNQFHIQHIANSVDPQTRTFDFYLPLENQWKSYDPGGEARVLWRFRPGTRVRLRVPVEKLENVFVVPRAAVIREGPEAFVFRQNGDLFDRLPVHVVHEDREHYVLANDGSMRSSYYIAQNAASSLNRVMKAQAASGMPANFHVHADGTVHAAH